MVKIKVPQQIKMGVHTYKIKLNPHLWHDEKLAGCVNHRLGEIQIDPNVQGIEMAISLIHEVLEVIEHINRENLPHEALSRIAESFTDFLMNNLGVELDWSDISQIVDK